MDTLPLNEIADMCGGTLHGASLPLVRRISKDTRTILPGDLYLALRGENHDGNLYAANAAGRTTDADQLVLAVLVLSALLLLTVSLLRRGR